MREQISSLVVTDIHSATMSELEADGQPIWFLLDDVMTDDGSV